MRFGTAVPIAAGATGRVVRVFDAERGEEIALKLLHRDDPDWVQRMLREAEVQMRLDHPHVCRVHGTGRMGEQPWIAMQLVDGPPLDEAAAGLPDRDKAALLAQVADAVHHAHQHGVVHRDLKPSNILVERRDGRLHAVVVDFGLVRVVDAPELTRTGQLLGTPGYMAPEQATAAATVDGRADVFSLGVIAFELLAGRRPFEGESAAEVLLQTLRREPPSLRQLCPRLDPALVRIVRQCLETDPDWRYADAAALRDDLVAFSEGRQVQAARDTRWRRFRRFARRHPWRAGLGATAALLALALLAASAFSVLYARQQSSAAQRYMEFAAGIEHTIRLESMKPAHDTAPVRAELRARVAAFAAELPRRGPAALRTGRLALGRALLALGDADAAQAHLVAAVAAGEDSQPLHAALGRVLMMQYFDALQHTSAIGDAALRQAAVEDLDRRHRTLAREHLHAASRDPGPQGRQMAALLTYLDGDAAAAEAALLDTAGDLAWPVDALLLAGELAATDALRVSLGGDPVAALDRWRDALARFREAGDIARSHAGAAMLECRIGGALATALRHGAAVEEQEWRTAIAACDRAIALDSSNAEAHAGKALAHADLGLLLRSRGQWTDTDLGPALQAARRAGELEPGDPGAARALGALLTQQSLWQAEQGDAGASQTAQEAIRLLEEAQERDPASLLGTMMLANAYLAAARAAVLGSGDGEHWLARADALLDAAAGRGEAPLALELHTVENRTWRGYEAYLAGRDAGETLRLAVARAERLAARAPRHPRVHSVLGMAAWTLADFQYHTGSDAGQAAGTAVAAYRHALARDGAAFSDLFNGIGALQLHARQQVDRGQAIGAELALLGDWLGRLARRAGDNDIRIQQAGLHQLHALEAVRAGSDPRPHFAAARALAMPLLAGSIDAREAAVLSADLAAEEHGWRERRGLADPSLAAEDERAVLAAMDRYPELALLRARAGAALLAMPPTAARQAKARALLEDAVARMPLLAGRYTGLLAAARPVADGDDAALHEGTALPR